MIKIILAVATAILLNACGSDSNPEDSSVGLSDSTESEMQEPTSMATTAVERQKILDECAKESSRESQAKEFADCVKNVPFDGDLVIPST